MGLSGLVNVTKLLEQGQALKEELADVSLLKTGEIPTTSFLI